MKSASDTSASSTTSDTSASSASSDTSDISETLTTLSLKKVFLQLGDKFGLNKDLVIFIYQVLNRELLRERKEQINFYTNLLSSHLCKTNQEGPIGDHLFSELNPLHYRFPIGRGNEWLIKSDKKIKDGLMYEGYYDKLSAHHTICEQIVIFGKKDFLLKTRISEGVQIYEPFSTMERIKAISILSDTGTHGAEHMFDEYYDYVDDEGTVFNVLFWTNTCATEYLWINDQG